MIEHCEQNHVATNLAFNRLDVESSESEAFCAEQDEKFDMVTSFSCLHWVPNQGGKFVSCSHCKELGQQASWLH